MNTIGRLGNRLTRRRIASALIILWVGGLIFAFVVPVTPTIIYSSYPDRAVFPAPCNVHTIITPHACDAQTSIPPTLVVLSPTFTAQGVFGATNPIHINAILSVNRSDFLQYYRGIGFFNAEYLNGTYQGVYLPLTRLNNVTYEASGTLQWATATNVSWYLVPTQQYFTTFLLGPSSNTTATILPVSGAQDTLTMRFNETVVRLTYVVIAFGFVSLLPVLDAVSKKSGQPLD